MRKNYFKAVLFVAISFLLVSCAIQKPLTQRLQPSFQAVDLNPKLQSGAYEQKADNFMIILDKSGSMGESFKGHGKLSLAMDTVSRMNETIPDLELEGALRIFGRIATFSTETSKLLYGPTAYSKAGFAEGLNRVDWARGMSPLQLAFDAASEDLKPSQGQIALIVLSDGKEMSDKLVLQSAEKIKKKYGDRLCIYTVLVGNDPAGKKLLEKVAEVGQCGFFTTTDQIESPGDMAELVEAVFLKPIPDSDGDGVYDPVDQCPDTPRGVKVDSVGCPLDTDGDGVYDYLDKCPGTPKGTPVDANGCPEKIVVEKIVLIDTDGDGVYDAQDRCPGTPKGAMVNRRGCWVIGMVHFDFDKSNIKPRYYTLLDEVAAVLKLNPSLKMEIQGHTDYIGPAKYNMSLSQKRAGSAKGFLVNKGIEKSRLPTIGYGLTRPIASNLTQEGRARNRRAELIALP